MAGKRGRPLVVLSLIAEERDYPEQHVRRHLEANFSEPISGLNLLVLKYCP